MAVNPAVININNNSYEGGNTDASLEIEPVLPPSVGDMEEMNKAPEAIRNAAALTVLLSAAAIVYMSVGLRRNTYNKYLSVMYAIAIFATFSFGMALLLLSFVRPQLPVSVGAAKKLVGVTVVLVSIAICLKFSIHFMPSLLSMSLALE